MWRRSALLGVHGALGGQAWQPWRLSWGQALPDGSTLHPWGSPGVHECAWPGVLCCAPLVAGQATAPKAVVVIQWLGADMRLMVGDRPRVGA
jgi:hypothetical protein